MPLPPCRDEKSTSVDSYQEQICLTNLTNELLSYNTVESACKQPSERIRRQKSVYFGTLERMMDELNENNPRVFKGMAKRLEIEKLDKIEAGECLTRVFKEMHTDKHYNWGRVVAVFAFLRSVAQHLNDCNKSDNLEEIASATNSFASEHFSTWINEQGGWETFEKFFREKSANDRNWLDKLYTYVGLQALSSRIM